MFKESSFEINNPEESVLKENKTEQKEKFEFLYHGTTIPDIKVFEPRIGLVPTGVDRESISPKVYATENPAFAAGHSFPWASGFGIELGFNENGKVILRVSNKLRDELNKKVYIYKMSSEGFVPTKGEGAGHSYDIGKNVKAIESKEFETVEDAVKYYGGIVEYYNEKEE